MKMRRLVAPLALAGVLVGLPPALAADNAQDFVAKAAQGGMFEVKSSEAIQGKAQDPRINDFAQTMIKDHGAANAKLQTIAGEEKLKVPADVDAAQKSDLDKLSGNAAQVDQDYVAMQQKAHADAVELFESYAKDGDNTQLKSFAAATAPTLRMHRDMIEKIAATMTGGAASDNASTPAANTSDNPQSASLVPGANSFTEAQAQDRIKNAGFADVSGLAKDDKGIWRGKATKDGKAVSVGLDYQGNVASTTE